MIVSIDDEYARMKKENTELKKDNQHFTNIIITVSTILVALLLILLFTAINKVTLW